MAEEDGCRLPYYVYSEAKKSRSNTVLLPKSRWYNRQDEHPWGLSRDQGDEMGGESMGVEWAKEWVYGKG